MNIECLLIKTKDNRKFLTKTENFVPLVEYAKVFDAEIYSVVAEPKQKVLSLKGLTSAICDPDFKEECRCTIVRKMFPKEESKLSRKQTKEIRDFIRKMLLRRKTVSLKDLKVKFKDYNIKSTSLSSHLFYVRKALEKEGYRLEKVGSGKYCLAQQIRSTKA